jgi:low affinity Fe/Cu permease
MPCFDWGMTHRDQKERARPGDGEHESRSHFFRLLALHASNALGTPWAFGSAAGIILVWASLGPIFRYSDTWQLVINTSTTIVTFLMVFLIQHTQNRDTAALRVKVDEIVRALDGARNSVINAEELEDDELQRLLAELQAVARRRDVPQQLKPSASDTGRRRRAKH